MDWRTSARALVLTLLAVVLSAAAEPAAAATTQIGAVSEIRAGEPPSAITSGGFTVQYAEASGSYAVPPGYGTITSWSHSAGTTPGTLTFKVYRPTGGPQEFVAVGSDTRTVTAGGVQTFAVQIAVRPGDRIGLSSDDVELAYESGNFGDRIGFFGIDLPVDATRATEGEPFPEFKLDVMATLESAAARDGTVPPPAQQGPGIAPPPPAGVSALPAITALRVAPSAFAAARSGPSVWPRGQRTSAATVTYRVNVATTVRFTVRSIRPGRRRGSGRNARCVAPTPQNRRAARCTREVPLRGSFTHTAQAGANSLRFTGRLGGRRLPPGAYRLVASPSPGTAFGQPARRNFRIVRR